MTEQNEQQTEGQDDFSNAFAEAAEARMPAEDRDELPDAPEVEQETEVDEAEAPERAPDTVAEGDVWTAVPETARRAYQEALEERERLRHSVHSNAGRVSALQRKINELESQLAGGYVPAASQAAPSGDTPTAQQVRDAMQTPEQWASFSEEYPEVAKAVDARIQVQFNQIQRDLYPLREDAQRRAQVEAEQFKRSQYGALEQAYPQWRQTINTPEFQSWYQTQPASIQSLVESDYADDAIALLNFYSSAKGAPATSGRIHDIQAQRQRRLEQSVETRGRQGAERPLAEDDFSSAFRAAVAKKMRGNY